MKHEQVPTARVRGSLPPLGPNRNDAQPHGFVLPLYTLYSPGQVALATFLGTPLAGCWLLARNFKKLGIGGLGWVMLVLGLFWTAGLCGLAAVDKLPGIISLGSIPAMVLVMRAVQGSELDRHTSLGGKTTSWGYAVLAGLSCLAIVFVTVVGIAIGYMVVTQAPSIDAPNGAQVVYEDGATEADAVRVRDALTEMEYFQGEFYVAVHREEARWVVSFAVTDEGYRDPATARSFGDLAGELSRRAFENAPVDIVLIDEDTNPRRRYSFEERLQIFKVGEDEVRYRNVTQEEVSEVASVLERMAHFGETDGKAAMVEREGDALRVEVWMPPDTEVTPLQNMIYPMWSDAMSRALGDRPIDLVLGDLEGHAYSTYRWHDRSASPVLAEDGTVIWYRDGGTLEEAQRLAEVVVSHREGADVLYAFVMRDDNFEPARAIVAIYTDVDVTDDKAMRALHQLAAPLSKAAFGDAPVDLRIVDDQLALQHLLSWEKRPRASRSGAIRPTP